MHAFSLRWRSDRWDNEMRWRSLGRIWNPTDSIEPLWLSFMLLLSRSAVNKITRIDWYSVAVTPVQIVVQHWSASCTKSEVFIEVHKAKHLSSSLIDSHACHLAHFLHMTQCWVCYLTFQQPLLSLFSLFIWSPCSWDRSGELPECLTAM